jgi:hypothetical protein
VTREKVGLTREETSQVQVREDNSLHLSDEKVMCMYFKDI